MIEGGGNQRHVAERVKNVDKVYLAFTFIYLFVYWGGGGVNASVYLWRSKGNP